MFEDNADLDFDNDLPSNLPPCKRPRSIVKKPRISLPTNIVKRKFPGPAGILCEIPENAKSEEVVCTQTSLSAFQSGPWREMCLSYENLVEKFNIKWIKINANLNKLHNCKAPFLGAVIQNIECFNEKEAIYVVLKDITGEIQGTISRSLYEEYSNDLIVGAAIILKQFSVITTASNKNHILTITSNNLVTIYTRSKDDGDKVRIVKIQEVSCEDFTKAIPKHDDIVNNLQKKENLLQPNPLREINEVRTAPQPRNIFEDDNFEDSLQEENQRKKFNFKAKNVTISCSQVSIKTNEEESEIWQDALDGMDANSFFEDF